MLGVSLSTVRRRMAEYHLSVHSRYSTINDDELDSIVREINSAGLDRHLAHVDYMDQLLSGLEL